MNAFMLSFCSWPTGGRRFVLPISAEALSEAVHQAMGEGVAGKSIWPMFGTKWAPAWPIFGAKWRIFRHEIALTRSECDSGWAASPRSVTRLASLAGWESRPLRDGHASPCSPVHALTSVMEPVPAAWISGSWFTDRRKRLRHFDRPRRPQHQVIPILRRGELHRSRQAVRPRPIGTVIAGWRVMLKVKVQGAHCVHSASAGLMVGASARGGPRGTEGHSTRS